MNNIILSAVKNCRLAVGLVAVLSSISFAHAHGDQNAEVHIAGNFAPGVYGKLTIGDKRPPPPVLHSRPVVIERLTSTYRPEPVYMYVPEEHSRNWARYCHRYEACSQNVYFVNPVYWEREGRYWDRNSRDRDRRHHHRYDDDDWHHRHEWRERERWER